MAIIRIGVWIWIWSTRHCGMRQEVACWFQCWKKSSSFMVGLTFFTELDWGWEVFFSLLRLLCISINLPYSHIWNSVIMSGLMLLVATWNCWITCKTEYAGLNWLNWLHVLILEGGLLIILIDCMIFLSPFLDVTRMCMSAVSFLAQIDSGILYI